MLWPPPVFQLLHTSKFFLSVPSPLHGTSADTQDTAHYKYRNHCTVHCFHLIKPDMKLEEGSPSILSNCSFSCEKGKHQQHPERCSSPTDTAKSFVTGGQLDPVCPYALTNLVRTAFCALIKRREARSCRSKHASHGDSNCKNINSTVKQRESAAPDGRA